MNLHKLYHGIRRRLSVLALGVFIILTLNGNTAGKCDPTKTIFGTPVNHHSATVNHGATHLEMQLRYKDASRKSDLTYYDVPAGDDGCPGTAAWDYEEGTVIATVRRNVDDVVLDTRECQVNSLNDDQQVQTCVGVHTVAYWFDISGGKIRFHEGGR